MPPKAAVGTQGQGSPRGRGRGGRGGDRGGRGRGGGRGGTPASRGGMPAGGRDDRPSIAGEFYRSLGLEYYSFSW